MKILNMQQGTTEWALARAGVVTASEVDSLLTSKFEARTGEGVKTYLYKKASERIMGYQMEGGGTWAMEQGSIMEKQALPWYEFKHEVEIKRVGLCLSDDGKIGCSPDGLIGDDSGIEIKCPTPPTHLKYLLEQRVPPEYLPQVHMAMLVTGRREWVFASYNPFLPPLVVHVLRDEHIMEAMRKVIGDFVTKLDATEKQIRDMMEATARRAGRE